MSYEVHLDWETASEAKLGKKDSVGAYKYAEHPSTHILSLSYTFPGERARLWIPCWPWPRRLTQAVADGATFVAHNAQFEKCIWRYVLHRHGVRVPVPTNWRCTMAACAYRGLPQGLGKVGDVLNLPVQKSSRGEYLIQKLCKPHAPSKKWPTGWIRPEQAGPGPRSDPDRYRREAANLLRELYKYNMTDVEAEVILDGIVGPLPASEQFIWTLDQAINDRGVRVDIEAVNCAQNVADAVIYEMTEELADITRGFVTSHNQVAKIVEWVRAQGLDLPDLKAETVEKALKGEPSPARRVLEIRAELGRTSLKKLNALDRCIMSDGRIRGMLQYHGAGTGRWAGRLAQPHNLPRPVNEDISMTVLIALIKTEDLRDIEEAYGGPALQAVSDAIRGMFYAAEDHDLIASDFSSIEARVLAWVAGEEWKLQAFERGEDIYCTTAEKIFGIQGITKKTHPKERQTGKIAELAGGFQGWIGAWRGFDKSDKYADSEIAEFMSAWRDEHPATRRLWGALEAGAGKCVYTGETQKVANVWFQMVHDLAGAWLTIVLPNGRRLWYYEPGFEIEDTPRGTKINVTYQGRNNKLGGAWGTIHPYGGFWTENVIQAIARDILVEAMVRLEYAGYPLVMTVHDESIAEIPQGFGSREEFDDLMSIPPKWAHGLPIEVDGWRGRRVRK